MAHSVTAGDSSGAQASRRGAGASIFRWLTIVAALIWLVEAVTGILLAYSFEINDSLVSRAHPPKDLAAIERQMDRYEAQGGQSNVNWIWSTAGLKDRYLLNYTTADGESRTARIGGDGTPYLETAESDRTFLEWVREVHLSLSAGKTGEWILTISGLLLLAYLVAGLARLWPRGERWGDVLRARRASTSGDRLSSMFRAVGLIGVVPAFLVVGAAVVIFFEHSIEGPIGAPPITMPAIAPQGEGIGFAAAARAAEAAVPGSRFVGGPMTTAEDATYKLWVNQPGEFFREQGYGGSLVLVNGNDGTVRGAWPLQKASAAYKAIALPYPIHTGEIIGPVGRFLVMLVGFWLAAMTIMGLMLLRRQRG